MTPEKQPPTEHPAVSLRVESIASDEVHGGDGGADLRAWLVVMALTCSHCGAHTLTTTAGG
jgi:hypothetical protein